MYFLFDIGGTKTRFAISKDTRRFSGFTIIPTPKNFKKAIAAFKNISQTLSGGAKLKGAVGGTPGPFNKSRTKIYPPNLPAWKGKNLGQALERALKTSVVLENDAALVGLGEAIYGAGRGKGIVVYLTISTGVGGARIVDGKIDTSAHGFEPGHQLLQTAPLRTLESFVSGNAFEKKYKKKPYEVLDQKIWNETARFLAYGLNNIIVCWSPDAVILGGSMMKKIGIPISKVNQYLRKITIFPDPPKVKKASLGDLGGLYGALALLKDLK